MITVFFSRFSSKKEEGKNNIFFVFSLIISLFGIFFYAVKGTKRRIKGEKGDLFFKKKIVDVF